MKVLVTGAAGLVGRPFRRLLEADHEVLGADVAADDGVFELDCTDPSAVEDCVATLRPGCIVHLAAMTNVDLCEDETVQARRVNADAAGHVARAAAAHGARLLAVSTDYVFDGRKGEPYHEEDPVGPLSVYGWSKLSGEDQVRAAEGAWQIVRCQSIYGHGRPSFVSAIRSLAEADVPLTGVTDQVVTPSYADDIAAALLAVLEKAPAGIYLASNAGSCTPLEWARATMELCGLPKHPIEPLTSAEFDCRRAERARSKGVTLPTRARRPAHSVFDLGKLAGATGFTPRPWREGLAAYLMEEGT
jgi:dTDP-4-dehydrorhamnose reductase